MIGTVATILGDAGVNISDMHVGREPERCGRADGDRDRHAGAARRRRADHRAARRAVGARAIDLELSDGSAAWRRAGRRPPPPPRRRSSDRRGCARSSDRPARGRCRSRASPSRDAIAGQAPSTGSTHGASASAARRRGPRRGVGTGGNGNGAVSHFDARRGRRGHAGAHDAPDRVHDARDDAGDRTPAYGLRIARIPSCAEIAKRTTKEFDLSARRLAH